MNGIDLRAEVRAALDTAGLAESAWLGHDVGERPCRARGRRACLLIPEAETIHRSQYWRSIGELAERGSLLWSTRHRWGSR